MKRNILLTTLVVCTLFIVGCQSDSDDIKQQVLLSKEISAQRVAKPNTYDEQRTKFLPQDSITFSFDTENVDSCVWSFDIKTKSKELKAKHVFDKPGSYPVALTLYSDGTEATILDTIKVHQLKIVKLGVQCVAKGMHLKHAPIEIAPEDLSVYLIVDTVKLSGAGFPSSTVQRHEIFRSNSFKITSEAIDLQIHHFEIDNGIKVPPLLSYAIPNNWDFRLCFMYNGEDVLMSGGCNDPIEKGKLVYIIPYTESFADDTTYCLGFNGNNGRMFIYCAYE